MGPLQDSTKKKKLGARKGGRPSLSLDGLEFRTNPCFSGNARVTCCAPITPEVPAEEFSAKKAVPSTSVNNKSAHGSLGTHKRFIQTRKVKSFLEMN